MTVIEARRPQRQDTFDLRGEIITDESPSRFQNDTNIQPTSDDEHSVLEDDSSNEDRDGEYMDEDDGSSSLSIPNESIDFDLVYSLHNFAATVEGQASVVKGDSLFLMDDSNSYWWLVRVLTTQEVGYIPAENIETPFERLARLNKHRNVDLASATQEELHENVQNSRERMRGAIGSRNVNSTSPHAGDRRTVIFTGSTIHNYPPAVWGDEELGEEEWDEEDEYEEGYDEGVEGEEMVASPTGGLDGMEPDDGMSWESTAVDEERARAAVVASSSTSASASPTAVSAPASSNDAPNMLKPGGVQQQLAPITISTQPSTSPPTQLTQQKGLATTLRQQTSRELLYPDEYQAQTSPASPSSPANSGSPGSATSAARMFVDPATAAGETRKISVTPSIAREAARQSLLAQQQEESAKRAREEALAAEEIARKKAKTKDAVQPVSSATIGRAASNESVRSSSQSGGAKLRKGRDSPGPEEEKKEKKRSVFGIFGRKKDKNKDKYSESIEGIRSSDDSGRSGSNHGHYTPSALEAPALSAATGPAASPQSRIPNPSDPRRATAGSTPSPRQASPFQAATPVVSQHSLKMQQIDQQQQALYQQYLKSSPASAPEGPSYGLQSAASIMPISNNNLSASFRSQGGRPGSLILSPTGLDGQGVPELSVIRVFAGPNLHTEATFKTVLLNTSTTSSDLIRQAMQRFRLAAAEDEADYYLEIKQVEGQSAVLLPHEKPLGVFEELVEAAQLEVPKVKRSSVGSISSVSSNLSMHPAIKKLSMNDFTDDSAVKFYLNRRSSTGANNAGEDEANTIIITTDDYDDASLTSPARPSLTVTTANGTNVTPERFSSPSARFALQVCILPDDLPDGMIFDPHTEAIVPRSSLRDRSLSNAAASSGVSQTQRRKALQFPKNTTVAEVIELALERFGIAEGVVDGGDEIEDKLAKRISLARVRYGLAVQMDGVERQLQPSSKILDAFQRPPIFKIVERRSGEKRRSVDSTMLLNAGEDVRPDDPIFMLRRAVGFRNTGKSKMSAPLDEIALQHLHQRESVSESSMTATPEDAKAQKMSRQELIAAQRLASREKQRAILSAESNSERGVDVLLPGNAMLRSSLHETSDKMRYSYVQDGEIFDISDIVEEEQRGGRMAAGQLDRRDWLEGVVARNHEGLGDNLDRVLSRIKGSKPTGKSAAPSLSSIVADSRISDASAYSVVEEGDPPASQGEPLSSSRGATPSVVQDAKASRAASGTPVDREKAGSKAGSYQNERPSVGSLRSDDSSNDTSSPSTPATTATNTHAQSNTPRRSPLIIKDDFGVSEMMAIIELNAESTKPAPPPPGDYVDKMLFGSRLNLEELHPRVREMFAGTFKQLDDMDRELDLALAAASHAF
ncbi:hypothetical protein JB92DRAFT_2888045 [Gautieria morchelliformis]|nr:hypothetical protein JB92DRAFT_2888045 [Gautieria morchelliformis]